MEEVESSDIFTVPDNYNNHSQSGSRICQSKNASEGTFSSSIGTLHVKEAVVKLLHCAYCNFTHKESKSMVSHMSTHTGKKPYKCRACDFSSNWKEVVARHAKARHNGSNLDVDQQFKYSVNKFICRVSDDRGELNLEEVTFPETIGKGNDEASSVDEDEPVLNIASAPNSCYGDSEEVESVVSNRAPSVGNNNSKLGLSGFRGDFKCELCPFRAEKSFHIDFHLKRHTQCEGADFKCPHCPYWVNAKKSLMRHIYLHEVENGQAGPPEEIDFSQEEMEMGESNTNTMSNYDRQMVLFQEQQNQGNNNGTTARFNKRATSKNRCDACPFVAGTKTQLLYHKQFHRPNRAAYKCPHCSYSVSHQHLLNQHLKVHFRGDASIPQSEQQPAQTTTARTEATKISESSSANIPFILVDSNDGTKTKMYHCRYCKTTNRKKMFIMAHEQLHSQGHNHVYRCSLCIFSTRIKNKYASHVDAHNEESEEPQSKKLRETLLSGPPKGTFPSSKNSNNSGAPRRLFSYICPDCPAGFKSPGDLRIHSVFHKDNNYPHSCPYCTYSAKNKPQLCKHLYVHTAGYVSKRANSYPQGKNLNSKTKTTGQAIEAFRSSTSRPSVLPRPPPLYVPQEQSKNFSKKPILDSDMIEFDTDFYKIDASSYSFALGKKIEKYVEQLCMIEQSETQSFLEKLKSKAKHRFIYRCPACPASFIKNNTMKFHISLHDYQGLLDCDRCSYSVDYEESFKSHQLLHVNSGLASASVVYTYNHRCPQCPAAFSKPSRLEKHLTLHGSDAKWKCDHCNYAVPYAATLVKHRHVHDSEKIAFDASSAAKLKDTVASSTPTDSSTPAQSPKPVSKPQVRVPKEGEKLYYCDRCPYSHSRRDAVQSHQKRHKSDSEVGNGKMCPHCDYVCLQPSYLREHIRLHTDALGFEKSNVDLMDLNKDLELEEEEIVGGKELDEDGDDLDGMLDSSMKEGVECEVEFGEPEEPAAEDDNYENFDLNIDWRDSFTDTHINMLATPAEAVGSRKSWNPFQDSDNRFDLPQLQPQQAAKSSQPRKRIRKPKVPVDPNSTETFGDLAPTRIRRQYNCEQCSFSTVNPREFLYHRRDEHHAKVKIVECPYCVYACQYFQKLQRHILLVHKLETSTTPPKATFPSGNPALLNPKVVDQKKSPSIQSPEESSQGELKIAEDMNDSMDGDAEGNPELGASDGEPDDGDDNFDLSFDWKDNFVNNPVVNMLATPDEVLASSQKWNPIQNNQNKSPRMQQQAGKVSQPRKRVRKPKMPVDPNSTVTFGDLAPTRVRRQYNCESCNFRTVNPREFLYHRRDDHQAKVKIVECPYCVYACQYFQKLQRHILLVHKLETSTTPPKGTPTKSSSPSKPIAKAAENVVKQEQLSQPTSVVQSPESGDNSDQNNGMDDEVQFEHFDSMMDSSMNDYEYEVECSNRSDGDQECEEEIDTSPRSRSPMEEEMDEEIGEEIDEEEGGEDLDEE